jgi:cAMP-dependent protein kinase regulator
MNPSIPLPFPVGGVRESRVTQATLLSSVPLHLDDSIRRSTRQAGRVILRTAAGRRRLVLTPAQNAILQDLFSTPRTVPEALARLLARRDGEGAEAECPPLGEYYELVLQAHAAGVLRIEEEPAAPTLAHEWSLRLSVLVGQIFGYAAIGGGVVALALLPWAPPATLTDLAGGWLVACGLLSLGQMLAACALTGGGCAVRSPHFHWRTVLPHFRIDTSEAVMGGRDCEVAVALLRAAPLVAGAGVVAWLAPAWLVLVLTAALFVLAPLPGSAAWQWLGARHDEPRFTVRSGALFEPRRADAWVRWNAWLADTKAEFGFAAIGWFFVWTALAVIVCGACQPGLLGEFLAVTDPGQGSYPSLSLSIFCFAMALILVVATATVGFLRHRAIKRAAARLERPGAAHTAALQGDTAGALRQLPLFQALAEKDLQALAGAMQPLAVRAGDGVFREDDPGDAFYVVLEGELEVLKRRPAPAGGADVIGRLGAGDSFGEIALLDDTPRSATIRATQACRLLRLARGDFGRLVVDTVGTAKIRALLQNAAFLGRLVFMAGWPSDALLRFAQRCHHVRYEAGEPVMQKGRANTQFFLIYDGTFEVRAGGHVLRRMRPGDYFGEISLLENGLATADVVAVEESRCLVLERTDFLEFFAKDFRIGLRMEALAAQRLGSELFVSR